MRLRTSDPSRPGYRRRRRGRGFSYLTPDGATLTDETHLERIRSLVIPPAWKDVWICPWPNGHLQAVGTDAAGRRQYLYHPDFRRRQEESKHSHVLEVAARLPQVRDFAQQALTARGLGRDRVLGCALRLLDLGFFRIGSESYAKQNGTYGLTTLERRHLTCHRDRVEFDFPAKHSRHRLQVLTDPDTCRAVRALHRRQGGDRLLAFKDRQGWHDLRGDDVNGCLKELTGLEVSAKDFRTVHATVLAAVGRAVSEPATQASVAQQRRAVARTVREVAEYLGDTPAVCRNSYINPRIVEHFEQGRTIATTLSQLGCDAEQGLPATHGPVEEAVRVLLTQEPAHEQPAHPRPGRKPS